MKYLFPLIVLIAFSVIISCDSNSSEPEDINEYMSLSVGDIREYSITDLNMYQIWEIKAKTKRVDNTEVYIGQWSSNLDSVDQNDISYYFIRDGYFFSTNLVMTANVGNPFNEQKLAKIYPKDGDKWVHTEGGTDSNKSYFYSKYIGDYTTPAGSFKDVFGFTLDNFLTVYYAKQFGHIGSSSATNPKVSYAQINYAKINGKDIGKFVPFSTVKLSKRNIEVSKQVKINFLGQFVK